MELKKSKCKPSNQGFTLIELIISITIITILSSLLYPNFSKLQSKAKEAAIKTIANSAQLAVETYALNNGNYPNGDNLNIIELVEILKKSGELTKIPKNPFTSKNYTQEDTKGKIIYSYNESEDKYTLIAYGKNNTEELFRLENL